MLVLTTHEHEKIHIGDDIVLEFHKNKRRITIHAPRHISIKRIKKPVNDINSVNSSKNYNK